MRAAVRAYGQQVLSDAVGGDPAAPEIMGRELLQLLFGTGDAGLPDVLGKLVREPDDEEAAEGLTEHASEVFESDAAAAERAAAMITAYYRDLAGRGDSQALVDLGDFLRSVDPEEARTAYQQAIDAGHARALIQLGKLLHERLRDNDAALAAYGQAERSGDPDLAAQAIYNSAFVHMPNLDQGAILQRVIDTRHPEWAPAAMVSLAALRRHAGDDQGAEAMYRAAAQAGNPNLAAEASWTLGELLERTGDADAATAEWRRVIDSGDPEWAGPALTSLVNLLSEHNNAEGLRAAYTTGAAHGNPEAPYALTQLGQVLESQGDIDGARQAWQQAVDAGCDDPDYWRERISPQPPRPRPEPVPYPADLPAEFDPRNMARTGIQVLERGLPPLPETLTYDMAIPVAYWKAEQCAVVLVLRFSSHGGDEPDAIEMQFTYSLAQDGSWIPPQHAVGGSFGYDPLASPDGWHYGLDGQAIVTSGGSQAATITPGHPARTAVGQAAPEVKYLTLIKDGQEDRRPLDSHFGAWVVCTELPGPFEIAALDANGTRLATLSF